MNLLNQDTASILSQSSLLLGESVFTSVLYYQKRLIFAEEHLDRLILGAKYLFPETIFPKNFKQILLQQLENTVMNLVENQSIRMTIVRDGYFITTRKWNESSASITIGQSEIIKGKSFKPSFIKLSNYGLEFLELKQSKFDELIYFDVEDNLTEATTSNIFLINQQNELMTPKLSSNVLDGIIRLKLIKFAQSLNISTKEVDIKLLDIKNAKCMFLTNAIKGIRFVNQFENLTFSNCESFEKIITSFGRYGEKI